MENINSRIITRFTPARAVREIASWFNTTAQTMAEYHLGISKEKWMTATISWAQVRFLIEKLLDVNAYNAQSETMENRGRFVVRYERLDSMRDGVQDMMTAADKRAYRKMELHLNRRMS